ncbi:MAG: formyltetrahydrofolate deformylase, partial [Candidatus Competibacter sp.]
IEQEVERVDHAHTPEQLAAVGRDIENIVLARAMQYYLERRVFLNGSKTVVLR